MSFSTLKVEILVQLQLWRRSVCSPTPRTLQNQGKRLWLLIGMKNKGEQSVKVLSIHASIHLPYLHMSMHNLSAVVITIHEMSFLDR
uniref:Uncharacterized protein n=1 Tax=Lactuca sativa TaxID=4236 RepID=A0A9R1XE89_LACSA|nr:hypothetical protein LSAT_V11C500256840 [Lactuca sativa]